MLDESLDLLTAPAFLWGLGVFSLVTFLLSLILVPWLIIRLPEDYFATSRRGHMAFNDLHPLLHGLLLVLKNVLGVILLLFGIAMLVLPGQGLLTMVIGLALMDFPGKYELEQKLVRKPPVRDSLNWIRRKAGRVPFDL